MNIDQNNNQKSVGIRRKIYSILLLFIGSLVIIFTLWISGIGFLLLGFLILFKPSFFKYSEERKTSQKARDQYVKMYEGVPGKLAPSSFKKDGLIRFYDIVLVISFIMIIAGLGQISNFFM